MKRTLPPNGSAGDEASPDPLRRPPPSRTLSWVARSVGAGSEVVAVNRLTEGHWHANHVVTVRDASGHEKDLVLRRWARRGWELNDPTFTPAREAAVLELLDGVPVRTPQLINLDSDGAECDVPAILTDRLPGGPPEPHAGPGSLVAALAEALATIHALDSGVRDRLLPYERYYDPGDPRLLAAVPPPWAEDPDLWMRALRISVETPPPPGVECLIHRDYHPGNTLWENGQLTGVVDWTQGSWGVAAVDTAHMRWNLAIADSLDAAERFLAHYRSRRSTTEHDQCYWDVVTVLDVLPELDPEALPPAWDLARLERYLATVLDQPGGHDAFGSR